MEDFRKVWHMWILLVFLFVAILIKYSTCKNLDYLGKEKKRKYPKYIHICTYTIICINHIHKIHVYNPGCLFPSSCLAYILPIVPSMVQLLSNDCSVGVNHRPCSSCQHFAIAVSEFLKAPGSILLSYCFHL